MRINPINVINLLLTAFQSMNIHESAINYKEIELKNHLETILYDAMNNFHDVEVIVEETLDFEEPFKNVEAQIIEDNQMHFLPEPPVPPTNECTSDHEELSYDYKKAAIEFWRSGKKRNLSIDSVRHRFKKVKSISQLHRWAHSLNKGGTYREKIARICQLTLDNFKAAAEGGLIVHDMHLRKWALQAQNEIGHEDFRFQASEHWVRNFKKAHRIVSRKINKFVTKKTLDKSEIIYEKAEKFVQTVKQDIKKYGIQNVYNSDQSGFELEMHSGRTLAVEGEKQIQCLVQSVSATTHSYTIQPLISGDGRLLSPLFIVLKEPSGYFGPVVETTMFRPTNVHLEASKSGKLTSEHFQKWLTEVYFPNVGTTSVLLIDSWSGHCPAVVAENTPQGKNLILQKIPTGTTGKIQPLDVFGFRIWKNFVRTFSDSVTLMNYDMNLHLRNSIIKLQSLVHNQLSSPRYVNMFKYSWYKSGYIEERPERFVNPVKFSFGESCDAHCAIDGCTNVAVIRCSWCKKALCFKHFYEDYHFCSTYSP